MSKKTDYGTVLFVIFIGMVIFTQCEKSPPRSEGELSSEQQNQQPLHDEPAVTSQHLLEASHDGDTDHVQQLIAQGADVTITDGSALMLAGFNGHTDIIRLLLEEEAQIEARNRDGRTALMFAASGPFPETVKTLLEAGANPDVAGEVEGWTALMLAAAEGHTDVVQVLLDHGADPTLKDENGETALDFATNNGHEEVVQLLQK